MMLRQRPRSAALAVCAVLLAACGGGGSGTDASTDGRVGETGTGSETSIVEGGTDVVIATDEPAVDVTPTDGPGLEDIVATDASEAGESPDAADGGPGPDATPADVLSDQGPEAGPEAGPDAGPEAGLEGGTIADDAGAAETGTGGEAGSGADAAMGEEAGADGSMMMPCPMGQTRCGAVCVDLQTSTEFCGSCMTSCSGGRVCSMGACACPAGQTLCGDRCVDTATNEANCGMCGRACGGGQSCAMGACACPTGQTLCGDRCVNVSGDEANCGMCGRTCGMGQTCTMGACACPAGQTACGTGASSTCVNAQTDNANCGACGVTCGGGSSCSMGMCRCPTGQTLCGTGASASCADTQTDGANCGACGTRCPTGQVCNGGSCQVTCTAPRVACGSGMSMSCADTQTDDQNCGACGTVCGTVPNSFGGICTTGSCRPICAAGFGNCNNRYSDGCEVNTTNDLNNCGSCGNVCPSTLSNADSVTCRTGSCSPNCNTNRGNCDGNDANGCESDSLSDSNNCGGCGNVCPGTQTCVFGRCAATSCRELHTRAPSLPTGTYWIDPDDAGPLPAFQAHCDMTFSGGGWTLIYARQALANGTTITEGTVAPGSNRYLSLARMQALANGGSQVHIRNPGQEATRSVTSVPNTLPIMNLRNGRLLNNGMANVNANNAASQTVFDMYWSGPYAQVSRFWFNCQVPPYGAATGTWPDLYWACNNANGLHLFSHHSSWVWTPGTGTAQEIMEVYVR